MIEKGGGLFGKRGGVGSGRRGEGSGRGAEEEVISHVGGRGAEEKVLGHVGAQGDQGGRRDAEEEVIGHVGVRGAEEKVVGQDKVDQLTEAEESRVTEVLAQDGSYVVVSQANANIDLTYKLIKCMLPEGLLNDEVVNFYGQLLQERSDRTGLKMHFFNSFFLALLEDGYSYDKVHTHTHTHTNKANKANTHTRTHTHAHTYTHSHTHTQVSSWSKKVKGSLFDRNMIFFPVHIITSEEEMDHWYLAIIDFKRKRLEYYDSMKVTMKTILTNKLYNPLACYSRILTLLCSSCDILLPGWSR
jgi:hypothetical protein